MALRVYYRYAYRHAITQQPPPPPPAAAGGSQLRSDPGFLRAAAAAASGGGGSARGGCASAHRVVRFLHIGNHRFHILLRRRHVAGRRLRSARRVSTGACIGCGTEGSERRALGARWQRRAPPAPPSSPLSGCSTRPSSPPSGRTLSTAREVASLSVRAAADRGAAVRCAAELARRGRRGAARGSRRRHEAARGRWDAAGFEARAAAFW